MLHMFICILSIGIHMFLCWHMLAICFFSFSKSHFLHKNALMVKLIFFSHIIFFYIQEILINKILDFLPLKVKHDIKYSCGKPQFIDKIDINNILVFTKVYLAEFFLSGNLQKFIHAKLKNFVNFWPLTFDSMTV